MASRKFTARHKSDRGFVLAFVVVAWVSVLIGFYQSVSERWRGEADYAAPAILQLHVFAFVGWLCLLTIQVLLIRKNRRDLHRMLGMVGATLIPVLVVTGLGAERFSQQFYSPKYPENLAFFIFPLTSMLMFAVTAVAAVLMRSDPPAHKRLILLSTTLILVAAYNRWWGDAIYLVMGDEYWGTLVRNCIGPDLLIAALVGYDLVTRGRVHPVFLAAVPPIVAIQLAAAAIYHSTWWPGVVRVLVGF